MKNKEFYKHALVIALPIMIQNGVTNLVNLLDNIMVGRIGTDPMSAVAVINQLMFVFNLCIFGGLSGIGIFTAQYYGKQDHRGVRDTFRLMVITAIGLTVIGWLVFSLYGTDLIRLYLHEDAGGGDVKATMLYAQRYLKVMLTGCCLLPSHRFIHPRFVRPIKR